MLEHVTAIREVLICVNSPNGMSWDVGREFKIELMVDNRENSFFLRYRTVLNVRILLTCIFLVHNPLDCF